ncbi:MAG: hypothetical protein ABII12_15655 [Planctomycetota bacterium]
MADYEISRPVGQCSVSGRAFEPGESFYSVVYETPGGYERRDVSESCWEGPPEEAVCHFRAQLPKKEKPQRTFVDDGILLDSFCRLANTDDDHKLRFRFVLSLILMRKRLLKYDSTLREDGREIWVMRLMRDKSLHRVFHPSMNDQEIEVLTKELGAILHGAAGGEPLADESMAGDGAADGEGAESPSAASDSECGTPR